MAIWIKDVWEDIAARSGDGIGQNRSMSIFSRNGLGSMAAHTLFQFHFYVAHQLASCAPRTEFAHDGLRLLVVLLDAKCDPNTCGTTQQSPLLYAVGLQDQKAVEDLLIAGAEMNLAPAGFEPPLCVAIRHRMGNIAKTLLTYRVDITMRGLPPGGRTMRTVTLSAPRQRNLPQTIQFSKDY